MREASAILDTVEAALEAREYSRAQAHLHAFYQWASTYAGECADSAVDDWERHPDYDHVYQIEDILESVRNDAYSKAEADLKPLENRAGELFDRLRAASSGSVTAAAVSPTSENSSNLKEAPNQRMHGSGG